MGNIKYSITVPVYNVEKYLRQCIESVLNQDYENLEIILVNDGSTDGSGAICDEYAARDNRIKVIHKENEGLLLTRRVALKHTTGDYVMFLDSDDYWVEGLLSRITDVIERYECDLVMFDFRSVFEYGEEENKRIFDKETVFEGRGKEELYKFLLKEKINNMCTKVVKKEIIDIDAGYKNVSHIRFGEDLLQSASIVMNSQKTVYIPDCLYCYRRGTGITSVPNVKSLFDVTEVRSRVTEMLENLPGFDFSQNITETFNVYLRYVARGIICNYKYSPKETKKSFAKICEHPYYIKARPALEKTDFVTKLAIFCAEHGRYEIIALMASLVEFKNNRHRKG